MKNTNHFQGHSLCSGQRNSSRSICLDARQENWVEYMKSRLSGKLPTCGHESEFSFVILFSIIFIKQQNKTIQKKNKQTKQNKNQKQKPNKTSQTTKERGFFKIFSREVY